MKPAHDPMEKNVTGKVVCPPCKGSGKHRWKVCRVCQGEGQCEYPRRCAARSKRTGQGCQRWVQWPRWVCYVHGGAPGSGPKGNRNAEKHGLFTSVIHDEADQQAYQWIQDVWEHRGADFDEFLLQDEMQFLVMKQLKVLRMEPEALKDPKLWDALDRVMARLQGLIETRGRLQFQRRFEREPPPPVIEVVMAPLAAYGTPPDAIDVTPEPKQLEPAKSLRVPAMPVQPEPELAPMVPLSIVRDPNDNNEDES